MKRFWLGLCVLSLTYSGTFVAIAQNQAVVPTQPAKPAPAAPLKMTPAPPAPSPQPRQLESENSILSPAGANKFLREAQDAAQSSNFTLAIEKATQAVTMLNQLSTFHESLAKSLNGIDNRIADEEKQQALVAAIKRDEATYQLAVIHRAQGKPELAVPLLVRIVASQGVDRALGKQAFQQLYEMGFTKTNYPRS